MLLQYFRTFILYAQAIINSWLCPWVYVFGSGLPLSNDDDFRSNTISTWCSSQIPRRAPILKECKFYLLVPFPIYSYVWLCWIGYYSFSFNWPSLSLSLCVYLCICHACVCCAFVVHVSCIFHAIVVHISCVCRACTDHPRKLVANSWLGIYPCFSILCTWIDWQISITSRERNKNLRENSEAETAWCIQE